jgi:hypothetical protein
VIEGVLNLNLNLNLDGLGGGGGGGARLATCIVNVALCGGEWVPRTSNTRRWIVPWVSTGSSCRNPPWPPVPSSSLSSTLKEESLEVESPSSSARQHTHTQTGDAGTLWTPRDYRNHRKHDFAGEAHEPIAAARGGGWGWLTAMAL